MIWLPDEVYKAFKAYAEKNGLTMTALITAYINECLNKDKGHEHPTHLAPH